MNKKVAIGHFNFYVSSKMLFPSFSPHLQPNLDKKEVIKKLKKEKCFLLRNIKNFDISVNEEFWYIIKDTFIPLEDLSKNTRNQIRKGLKSCTVKRVDEHFIKTNCYDIYAKSILGYGGKPIAENEFKNQLDDNKRDYWVVVNQENNSPIAYCNCKLQENTCNYAYIKYHPDYLKLYPSYALHYEMDKYYLDELKLKYVNVGARSLHHETNVQKFLVQKFKYRKAFCDIDIIYKPGFKLVVNMLYPFRKLINKIGKLKSVSSILKQHEIYRLTK